MLFTMDESVGDRQDSTGRGNIVEDNNGVLSDGGAVGSGSAGDFDGSTNFLNNTEPPNDIQFQDTSGGSTDWTIAVWVNADTLASDGGIFWVNADTLASDGGIFTAYTGAGNGGFFVDYDQSQDRFRVGLDNGTATTTVDADTLGAVSTATWYFLVAQYDAGAKNILFSVNNGNQDTGTHTGSHQDGTGDLEVGVYSTGSAYWDGKIDQPMVWWRKISAAEIAWHYNSGSGRVWSALLNAQVPAGASTASNNMWWV
jgi:hypothetical protein